MAFKEANDMVCKLRKALYGLKQAPRQWYAKINSFLVESLGYTNCSYEPCLYTKHSSEITSLIALYVDDLLIAGNNRQFVDKVKNEFQNRFKMKDLGVAQEFLGIEITRNRQDRTIHLCQSSYALKIINRFGMSNCNSVPTPMVVKTIGDPNDTEDKESNTFPYREAIGSLMYLMIGTRPDLAYAIGNESFLSTVKTHQSQTGYQSKEFSVI